jgi:hypothetical protein
MRLESLAPGKREKLRMEDIHATAMAKQEIQDRNITFDNDFTIAILPMKC